LATGSKKGKILPSVKDNFDGMKNWNNQHSLEAPPSQKVQNDAKKNENM
jgi:hypothetical protein